MCRAKRSRKVNNAPGRSEIQLGINVHWQYLHDHQSNNEYAVLRLHHQIDHQHHNELSMLHRCHGVLFTKFQTNTDKNLSC